VNRFTLVGQSASEVRSTTQPKIITMITNPHSHLPKPEPYQRLSAATGCLRARSDFKVDG
jgi:hypothetical protein